MTVLGYHYLSRKVQRRVLVNGLQNSDTLYLQVSGSYDKGGVENKLTILLPVYKNNDVVG